MKAGSYLESSTALMLSRAHRIGAKTWRYVEDTRRYLLAVRQHEREQQDHKLAADQQSKTFDTSLALRSSSQHLDEQIARRARVKLAEVPYLATLLTPGIRQLAKAEYHCRPMATIGPMLSTKSPAFWTKLKLFWAKIESFWAMIESFCTKIKVFWTDLMSQLKVVVFTTIILSFMYREYVSCFLAIIIFIWLMNH